MGPDVVVAVIGRWNASSTVFAAAANSAWTLDCKSATLAGELHAVSVFIQVSQKRARFVASSRIRILCAEAFKSFAQVAATPASVVANPSKAVIAAHFSDKPTVVGACIEVRN